MFKIRCLIMTKIQTVQSHYYKLPLDEVLVDAKHGNLSHFELIITQILDENGELLTTGDNERRYFEAPWVHQYNG